MSGSNLDHNSNGRMPPAVAEIASDLLIRVTRPNTVILCGYRAGEMERALLVQAFCSRKGSTYETREVTIEELWHFYIKLLLLSRTLLKLVDVEELEARARVLIAQRLFLDSMEIMLVEHGRQNQERPQKNVALSDHFFRVLGTKEHLRFVDFWFRIKGSRKEKYEPIRIFYDDERTANLVITRYHWHYFLVWTGVFQGWDNATRSARRIVVTCDEVFNTPYVQGVRLDMLSRPLPRLAWNAGAIFDYITLATERALLRDSYETAGKALVDQMKKDIDGAITGRKFLEIVERCIQRLLSLNEELGQTDWFAALCSKLDEAMQERDFQKVSRLEREISRMQHVYLKTSGKVIVGMPSEEERTHEIPISPELLKLSAAIKRAQESVQPFERVLKATKTYSMQGLPCAGDVVENWRSLFVTRESYHRHVIENRTVWSRGLRKPVWFNMVLDPRLRDYPPRNELPS